MQSKKENIIAYSTFLVLFVFLIFYITSPMKRVVVYNNVVGEKGVFDFRNFDFEQFQLSGLNGNIEFYWNQLLEPTDFNSKGEIEPDGYIHIPGIWNNFEVKGKKAGSYGFATYRFKILLSEDDLYSLKIKGFVNAYKVWVNGELLTETGVVGRTHKTMVPSWKRKIVLFKTSNKIADVVIQISNFQHRKGGPESIIVFGKSMSVFSYRGTLLGIELFILGVLFILCSYHLVLFFFRQKDLAYLYFSIICFLMIARLITTGEKIILEAFPHINWLFAVRIEYLSYTIIVPFFLLFLYQFYKEEFSRTVIKWVSYNAGIFSAIIIFSPPIVFSYTPIVYQYIIAVTTVYVLICLIIAVIHKRDNSIIFLMSYLIYGLVVINDILYFNNLIRTGFLMSYGIFVIAYAQSIVLSKNVSMAFVKMEDLSVKLDLYNKQLEKNVADRTEQIKIQKDEIEKQSDKLKETNMQLLELSAFKESLTSMIIHDLKNPLNIVLNFSQDERVLFAGAQMLNLVHNLLDVQRYEDSVMKLSLNEVSLHELIQKAVFQMNFLIKEKNIQLDVSLSKDYQINVDEEIINRVFVNLLSNALKFTPVMGNVSIFIKEKADSISICFADSGPGIPKDQKIIYEKFGQLIVKRAGRSGSTGLGLTFCKMAIEAHNGTIHYSSVLGKGATFCCTLPNSGVSAKIHLNSNTLLTENSNIRLINQLKFSMEEKQILEQIIDELSGSEIYEIGKIKMSIKKLDQVQTENIKLWISELQLAIWNSDIEKYKQLIVMARE